MIVHLEFVRPMATLGLGDMVPANLNPSVRKTLTDDGGCGGSELVRIRVPTKSGELIG